MFSWCCCRDTSNNNEEVVRPGGGVAGWPLSDDAPPREEVAITQQEKEELATPRDPLSSKSKLKHEERNEAQSIEGSGATSESKPADFQRKEKEKERLQRLVKDFATSAVDGIDTSLWNEQNASTDRVLFQMERYLRWFTIFYQSGSTEPRELHMEKIEAVTKSRSEINAFVPSAPPHVVDMSVLIDSRDAQQRLLFVFKEPVARDRFYTCMKILRLSVHISRQNAST